LIQQGDLQANSDHSLLIKSNGESFTVLLVYVDDVILVGDSIAKVTHMKYVPDASFKINDLGLVKYILALEVVHRKKKSQYCIYLIKDSGLLRSKPINIYLTELVDK